MMDMTQVRWLWLVAAAAWSAPGLCAALAAEPAAAPAAAADSPRVQRMEQVPSQFQGADIVEQRDAQVPMDLRLTDEQGRTVRLGDFFDGKKPVVLQLGYYTCENLCNVVLQGLAQAVREMDWTPGVEYDVVSVSIDPRDMAPVAKAKKANFLTHINRPAASAGWHFLTGEADQTKFLADTVGFHFRFDPRSGQYAHDAALIILSPDGRVSNYAYGVKYPPDKLKDSLMAASGGQSGSAWDKFAFTCFHYVKTTSPAMLIMQAGGVLTVMLIAGVVTVSIVRDNRRRAGEETLGD
jgi:protein SCO1/2